MDMFEGTKCKLEYPPFEGWHPAGTDPENHHRVRITDEKGNVTWGDWDRVNVRTDDGMVAIPDTDPLAFDEAHVHDGVLYPEDIGFWEEGVFQIYP
jgi:hypothetical protein